MPGESDKPKRNSGNHLPTARAAARHKRVVELRADGFSWRLIEERTGLSAQQCRAVWKRYVQEQVPYLEDFSPTASLVEFLERYERLIERLAVIAEDSDDDRVTISALAEQRQALNSMLHLLQQARLLPRNLARIQVELDLRFAAHALMQIIDAQLPPIEAKRRIVEVFSGKSPRELASASGA
jgi:hypothetical protein